MAGIKRFITYIYAYENGTKGIGSLTVEYLKKLSQVA